MSWLLVLHRPTVLPLNVPCDNICLLRFITSWYDMIWYDMIWYDMIEGLHTAIHQDIIHMYSLWNWIWLQGCIFNMMTTFARTPSKKLYERPGNAWRSRCVIVRETTCRFGRTTMRCADVLLYVDVVCTVVIHHTHVLSVIGAGCKVASW